jgi:hypothetical protein
MLECESVLTRSEHLTAARISMAEAEVLLDAIALVAEPIRIWYLWRPLLRAPGDDLVHETAVSDIEKALRVLKRSGKGNAPVPGDELPQKATRRRR